MINFLLNLFKLLHPLDVKRGVVVPVTRCKNCGVIKSSPACTVCKQVMVFEHVELEQYRGTHFDTYRNEWSDEHTRNAMELLKKVNSLIHDIKKLRPGLDFQMTSGWRPAAYNVKIGGALRSRHIIAQAIDFNDPAGEIATYLCLNTHMLKSRELSIEHPRYTAKRGGRWLHIQYPPPRSGRTVFIPYSGKPPLNDEEFQALENGEYLAKI